MLEAYRAHVADRAHQGVPPLPLSAQQAADLCALLKNPPVGEEEFLVELLRDRIPPGVDQAAYVKATFPQTAIVLSKQLTRLSLDLQALGVSYEKEKTIIGKIVSLKSCKSSSHLITGPLECDDDFSSGDDKKNSSSPPKPAPREGGDDGDDKKAL